MKLKSQCPEKDWRMKRVGWVFTGLQQDLSTEDPKYVIGSYKENRSDFPQHHSGETQNNDESFAAFMATKVSSFGNHPHPQPSAYPLTFTKGIFADRALANLEQLDH
jgi:hypothetical protein